MKVHQMKALSQFGFLRTPFQMASQAARPAVSEDTSNAFRKVPSQLIFDLELEEGLESRPSSRSASAAINKLEQVMVPFSQAHAQLLEQAEQAWRKIVAQTHGTGTSALADALCQIGYEARPRMAVGGSNYGSTSPQNLCHRYVSCSVHDAGATVQYVVDPHFREQFEIARPTTSYRGLLEAIPEVVVLPENPLLHLVQFLCHELGECFKQVGEAIPPWRRPASMASKWQHRRSLDGTPVSMTADSSFHLGAPHLLRASALPAVGKLIGPSSSGDANASAASAGSGARPTVADSFPSFVSTQVERIESIPEGNQMITDVRRFLTFY